MSSIDILGKSIEVSFQVGQGAGEADLDRDTLIRGAQDMAALINSREWPARYRDAYHMIGRIVFFAGKVMVNGYLMDRPCCDQEHAIFYWEAEEFMRNTDADVRGETFFHDCWHVVQFRRAGNAYARGEAEQVAREVDAINEQLEVARILGCDEREMQFLRDFQADQARIKARLEEGVNAIAPHKPGVMTRPAKG